MKKLSRNRIILVVIIVISVLLGVSAYTKRVTREQNLILVKQVNVSVEDRKVYEQRIQKNIDALTKVAPEKKLEQGEFYQMIANDYMALGQLGEAKKNIEAAIKLAPKNPAFYQGYAILLDQMNDDKDALDAINKALDIRPELSDYWLVKISVISRMNASTDEIKEIYESAIQKTKPNIDMITAYARYLESIGDTQGAIDQWNAAIIKNADGKSMYQPEITRLTSMLAPGATQGR